MGRAEICFTKIRSSEPRDAEFRFPEVCRTEVDAAEIRSHQVRPAEVHSGEVRLDLEELLPPFIPCVKALLQLREVFRVGHIGIRYRNTHYLIAGNDLESSASTDAAQSRSSAVEFESLPMWARA